MGKKRKESVVIFEGEETFIKPRTRTYDLKSGKSEYVGLVDDNNPSGSGEVKDPSYGYNMGQFVMPDPNDPLFCDKVKDFINSRGNGNATPQEIMSAYNAFNQFCKSTTSAESSTTTQTTSTTTQTTTISTSSVGETTTKAPESIVSPSFLTSNLGEPPSAAGAEAKKEKPKNKNLLYILLGIGVLGAAAYYFSKKKR